MAKPRKNKNPQAQAMRVAQRDAYVSALRDGRKERASTFADRKRQADRRACRGKVEF